MIRNDASALSAMALMNCSFSGELSTSPAAERTAWMRSPTVLCRCRVPAGREAPDGSGRLPTPFRPAI